MCEFSDLFSLGADELGSTDLIKPEIQTGDAKPVQQPLKRLPLSERKQAEEAIEETISQCMVFTCCVGNQEGWQYQILYGLLETQ